MVLYTDNREIEFILELEEINLNEYVTQFGLLP